MFFLLPDIPNLKSLLYMALGYGIHLSVMSLGVVAMLIMRVLRVNPFVINREQTLKLLSMVAISLLVELRVLYRMASCHVSISKERWREARSEDLQMLDVDVCR
jgi:hypothetical protein